MAGSDSGHFYLLSAGSFPRQSQGGSALLSALVGIEFEDFGAFANR